MKFRIIQKLLAGTLFVGNKPGEVAYKWALFKIIGVYKGEDIAQTKEQNPVQLERIP